nr:hypothetical protein [uncultured Pseudomonas sp.]
MNIKLSILGTVVGRQGTPQVQRPGSTKSITDEQFYALLKPIRNKFRKYEPVSILSASMGLLYREEIEQINQIRKQPWIHLVLLKWVFVDDQVSQSGRPRISDQEFDELINKIYRLSWDGRKPSQYEDLTLFFRALAAQQFLYQNKINLDAIARQNQLFLNVNEEHFFQRAFVKAVGLPISSFIRLSLGLLSRFMEDGCLPLFRRDYFSPIEHEIDSKHVDAFLKAISIPISELSDALRDQDSKMHRISEFIEETPFLKFPLLKSMDYYCCVYPQLLAKNLDHFVFDTLKKTDSEKFRLNFGRRFEAYIGGMIAATGLVYRDEKALEKKLVEKGKLVDFLVVDGDANIYIEAKAVEMAPRGKAAHLREVVRGATSTSLLKAVEQAHAVNERLFALGDADLIIRARPETYLIVVTYKELYIGNGVSLASAVGQEELSEIYAAYPESLQIPVQRMFFLTIEELEKLLQLVTEKRLGLLEALKRAEATDSDPAKRKFIFAQHLSEWPESVGMPSPHAESFIPVIDGLINVFKE